MNGHAETKEGAVRMRPATGPDDHALSKEKQSMNTLQHNTDSDRAVTGLVDRAMDNAIKAIRANATAAGITDEASVAVFARAVNEVQMEILNGAPTSDEPALTLCPDWCDHPEKVQPGAARHEGHSHFSREPGGYLPALLSTDVDGQTSNFESGGAPLMAACAYRREVGDHPDGVLLHITSGTYDTEEVLLPFHARQLARQLIAAADLVDGGAR